MAENATIQQALIHGRYNFGDDITVIDTVSNFRALTVGQIRSLGDYNVDVFSVGSDTTGHLLRWTVEQAKALLGTGIVFNAGSTVIISDSAANIASLTPAQIGALGLDGKQVRGFDVTDNQVSLSVAQFVATTGMNLQGQAFWPDDAVTLVDTAENIQALPNTFLGTLGSRGVVAIDVTDGRLNLTLGQLNSLSAAVKFAASDVVSVTGTAADFAGLSATMLDNYAARGVDLLNATDAVRLTVPQAITLVGSGLGYSAASSVTVSGAVDELSAAQLAGLAAKGVDVLDAAAPVTLTAAQAAALAGAGTVFAQGDDVTVRDTASNLASLSAAQISALIGQGVDLFDVSGNAVTLSVAQVSALNQAPTRSDDIVSVSDTGATIAGLTPAQIQTMAAQGVSMLDATNDALNLSLSQLQALGSMALNGTDAVALSDAASVLANLTAAEVGRLMAKGVDALDFRESAVTLSLDQFVALGAIPFAANDRIQVNGTRKADTIIGRASDEIIMGLDGNDRLNGGSGDDVVWSGRGKDILIGGTGRDVFVFSTRAERRAADKVTDFNAADDTFWLDNGVFRELGRKGSPSDPAKLKKGFFTVGRAAKDGNDHLIYDRKSGKLSYDADGNGIKAAVEIAVLKPKLALSADDFRIV